MRTQSIVALGLFTLLNGGCGKNEALEESPEAKAAAAEQSASLEPGLGDFETNGKTQSGKSWAAITDEPAGGASTVTMEFVDDGANGTKKSMHLKGNVRLENFPFPFSGARVAIGVIEGPEAKGIDVTKFEGIEFWTKGDGKEYMIRVMDERIRDFNFHHYKWKTTSEWERHRVAFKDLAQFDWGDPTEWNGQKIKGLMITNYSAPGEEHGDMSLFMDEITLY